MVGSGTERGQPKEGPSGLDVCGAVFVDEPGSRRRLDLRVRSAKNDQEGAGETAVVYGDELGEGLCATRELTKMDGNGASKGEEGCTKGAPGCKQCCRRDCKVCGKLFRGVAHGKVRDTLLSRQGLNRMPKGLFRDLEEAGVVLPGTAKAVSGISLRAGGVTETAACGMEKQLLAGHGRWKSLSGPDAYAGNGKRAFGRVSTVLQESPRQASAQRR